MNIDCNYREKVIAGFGEVMLRLCPADKLRLLQTLPGALNATFGGGEANVCASVAIFGGKSRYITALPDNPVSAAFTAQMRGQGVDVSGIMYKKSGRMGVYYVETGANQRPSTVVYDREHSVIAESGPDEYNFAAVLENIDWLHLSGITPALSRKAFEATLKIALLASEKGITISCDLNFRKKLWRWQPDTEPRKLAGDCMSQIIPLVDVIIANEEDAADVFGIRAAESDVEKGEINLVAYRSVAEQLVQRFPKAGYVAITLRESISADHNNWGAMLFDAQTGTAHYAPLDASGNYHPYQIHNIVDRVGGGDSFAAGLIYAMNSRDLAEPATALSFAVAASCLKHSIKGDFNYVTLDEVKSLMKGNASGRVKR